MDDVTKSKYAEWLEEVIKGIMENKPEKIGVCALLPDGSTMTNYFGECYHNDKAIMAHTFNLDAIWEVTTANEYLPVTFTGELSTANNCICNACHYCGYVVKLVIPETAYTNSGKLKTKYRPFWLCRKCRDKLVKALEWEGEADA